MTDSEKQFGVDIAATRADDLDKLLLTELSLKAGLSVLDIGSGAGGQSKRMHEIGAKVEALDIQDYSKYYADIPFTCMDAMMISALDYAKGQYDYVLAQRVIHYLPYSEAYRLLSALGNITGTALYISVTGIESDIGKYYSDITKDVHSRFSKLEPEGRELFSISESICLYSRDEFETLLRKSGWSISKYWTSAFGNHKAIATPIT